MDLEFSDEQNMLRDAVSKFCETEYTFDKREKIVESNLGHSPDLWKQFAELGWLGMPFSEKNGGYDAGPIELSIIFEEFGKHLIVEPYLSNIVMSGSLLESTDTDVSRELINNIISGNKQVSVAFSEPDNGYKFHDISCSVADNKINGTKSIVLNAEFADKFIVYLKNENNNGLYLVDADTPGLSINSFNTIDGSNCGDLHFEDVSTENTVVLLSGDDATQAIDKMLDLSILCICAEAIGGMFTSYTKTVQYTKEREQFGQPISNFQVLQHRMVEMFMETEIAKSLLMKAMMQLDANDKESSKTISALKAQVGKASRIVGQEAVQLHGGMGVSNEMSIGHYLKKFTAIDSMFGNRIFHLKRFTSL